MASAALPPLSLTGFQTWVKSHVMTKPQPPPSTTDLSGQTCIITGSNTGLGFESARLFLQLHLSHLIMAVRSFEKGEAAAEKLRKESPGAKIEVWKLDMLSYDSIQDFASRARKLDRLDIAILNAGISNTTFNINPSTGHEEIVQVNYLSTALLAILLLPTLKEKSASGVPGKLTLVGSSFGLYSKFENRDADPLIPSFDIETKWAFDTGLERYSVSKTLLLMLLDKLSQLVDPEYVVINALEPGWVHSTGVQRNSPIVVKAMMGIIALPFSRSARHGSYMYADAAIVQGRQSHGAFRMNWETYPFHPMMYEAAGKKTAERLWEETLSEFKFADLLGKLQAVARDS
ncbi:unnamed protein product [Clonostachys rosea f. rosea IK726]|uniref:Short-chain dehydrogenase/reductase family protein n=2 Tax=Bionectria ochroleuca TaxID=29856 RepID=A0A0B7K2B5_BIOOC|nr:unnamed protein product [Clonostachys rosea f. rosea IK726]